MAVNININNTNFGTNGIFFVGKNGQSGQNPFAIHNANQQIDPIAEKRKEAQKKAMKVVGDAWDTDKEVDKSIAQRREQYQEMLAVKNEAQSMLNDIDNQIAALKEEYGITEDMKYKDWPADFKQAYSALNSPVSELKKQIHDAEVQMKDAIADIRAITIERLKSNPMLDAQKTADAINEATDEEIISMVMQDAKEHIEKTMEEAQETAEKTAEEKEMEEEKLEEIQETKALQEAMIEQTKEAVDKAKAENQENNTPDIPLADLMKIAQSNSETNKARNALKEIKNSMSLLEADLTGIEVDQEI